MNFLHPTAVGEFLNRSIEPTKWMKHVKSYVVNATGSLLSTKRVIFRMESQGFKTYPQPSRHMSVVVRCLL